MKRLAGRTPSTARDHACIQIIGWLICLISLMIAAQARATTTQYYYDDLGRIVQSVRSDGAIHQYQYDGTGNVLAINRVASSTVSISGLTPRIGHAGASVTIYGSGFSTTLAANQVHFGTGAAIPVAATATSLTVTVPQDAVTGPVSVTVGGVTAVSAMSYTVRRPEITAFTPVAVAAGGAGFAQWQESQPSFWGDEHSS